MSRILARTRRPRIAGCILGGAIGDSLGAAHEGRPSDQLRLRPPSLTDDTQLTLATCEALLQSEVVSPESIAERFLSWYRERRLSGLGSSTLKALRDLDAGAHWAISGAGGERSAGNGAAMRIAPVAFRADPFSFEGRRTIRDVCRITHRNEHAYIGALAIALAIQLIVTESWDGQGSLCAVVSRELPDSLVRDRLAATCDLGPEAGPADFAERFGASGFVAESVPLAILAAQSAPRIGFEAVVEQVVAIGGDTDTNASMAGQLAGTWFGEPSLPLHWLDSVPERELLFSVAAEFAISAAES